MTPLPPDAVGCFKPLAVLRSWEDVRRALRARSDALAISRATLDRLSGLADGHVAKLLAPVPAQGFGPISLPNLTAAMGCVLLLCEDAAAIEQPRQCGRLTPRDQKAVRASDPMQTKKRRAQQRAAARRGNSTWGKIMAARRMLVQSPHKRSQIARIAAKVRWRDARAAARP